MPFCHLNQMKAFTSLSRYSLSQSKLSLSYSKNQVYIFSMIPILSPINIPTIRCYGHYSITFQSISLLIRQFVNRDLGTGLCLCRVMGHLKSGCMAICLATPGLGIISYAYSVYPCKVAQLSQPDVKVVVCYLQDGFSLKFKALISLLYD